MENEDDDPVGRPGPHDPVAEFRSAAEATGLIRPDDPIDRNLIDFAFQIVERCTCVAGPYSDLDHQSAAKAIRAELGEN